MATAPNFEPQDRATGGAPAVIVLVVDDILDNRLLCRSALQKKGFVVREAVDGCEALLQVEQQHPDVILMDVMMPNMDGLECTRRLKASAATRDIPVIILSACTDAGDIIAGLEAGAEEYLIKPYRLIELEVRLRSMVRLCRDRKEIILAREAQAARNALEAELAERRRMEDALRQAKEAAEAANLAKGEFLATMSHELRTPLNGVIGMTELLLRTGLDDRQRHYASVAKHSGNTLLCLINDILDFSKIEAGKIELEAVEFDIQDIISCTVASLEEAAKAKGLVLVGAVHPLTSPRIFGDPGRLQQVLMNLTSNALKFTEKGRVTVRAVMEETTDTHLTVRFTVDDTGIGIPSERLDRLFRSFSQVDASTTRKYGGTGLGLAICKRLVELMGGTIGVSTEPGLGSTFWFTVRFACASAQGHKTPPIPGDLRRVRVLAVDDNAVNREILREQLSECGICIQTECDGQRALDALLEAAERGEPIGMAILDMQMPGLDGEQLAQAIKANPKLRDTVLIMLSSTEASRDDERLRMLGFAAWLAKPVNTPRLLESIASALACAARVHTRVDLVNAFPNGGLQATGNEEAVRILLVDDNEIGRAVASAALTQAGYRCDIAKEGGEAVEAAQQRDYDIILMDCQMPNMDGFEATRAIRQLEAVLTDEGKEAKHTPVIALTANATPGDRERCAAAGMDEYLTKPFATDDLIAMIHRFAPQRNMTPTEPGSSVIDTTVMGQETAESEPQPGSDSATGSFDFDAILKRWGGDRQFAVKLIQMFQSQAPEFIEKLRRLVTSGDHVETANTAHGLKGAAAYVSASSVRDAAEELEHMGRAADLSDAIPCLSRIEHGLERCLLFDLNSVQLNTNDEAKNEDSPNRGGDSSVAVGLDS
ncbi:MAG: response regulator [Planctomycetes bacterium]|nr:response regulator [Planctomycetota bacterium]MBI3836052.1 response regulator [Planctomycetota bacterium]